MKDAIVSFFPATLRKAWEICEWEWDKVEEIRIRVDKPIVIEGTDREYVLLKRGVIRELTHDTDIRTCVIYRERELDEMFRHLCKDSIYAYEEERRQGFLTVRGGHRIGITGELAFTDSKSCIVKYIRYINIRVAHEIKGIANGLMKWLCHAENIYNTLIVSSPGAGKTTLLRDIARNLSNGTKDRKGYTVGMIDERGEIAGAYRGSASLDCGMRTDVITGGNKQQGTRILIRTFAPRIIIMDEIGMKEDAEAVLYAGISGCSVIATIHGNSLDDLKNKMEIQPLLQNQIFQRILFLYQGKNGLRRVEIWNGEGMCLCGESLLQEC